MNTVDCRFIYSALVAAKGRLSPTYHCDGKEQFICLAIDEARLRGECDSYGAKLAVKLIGERLRGCPTIEMWLEYNIPHFNERDIRSDSVQQYRHRWMNALIKEFNK